jgi:hypothetical protein
MHSASSERRSDSMDVEVVRATDLHGYARTPWCADTLVCAERALVRHPPRMDVYLRAGRPAGAGGWSPLAEPRGHTHARARSDFFVPPVSNAHELGDMRSSCSLPCPPTGMHVEGLDGGRQRVPRRVQVACTIASMGQANAGACGLTRTCAVVANCHHRATCGFAPARRAVRAGPAPALGLIRTAAVVPIRHHRVTWGSTEPPMHQARSDPGEQTGQQWFCQIGRTI